MKEKLRIGFIGAGGIAQAHYQRLMETGRATVAAITEPSQVSLKRFLMNCEGAEGLPVYRDYKEMLKREPLDGVIILSPHTTHYSQIKDALEMGIHVLTEKPMVCTIHHAKALIGKAYKSGRVLMISYQRHYDPLFRYMRSQIEKGAIGEVQFVQAVLCQEWLRLTRNTWRQVLSLSGGGHLNDSGSHLVDILMWVTGMKVREVSALQMNFTTDVDINTALTLRFENGALGNLSIIGNAPAWYEDHTIVGSKGAFYLRQGSGLTQQNARGRCVSVKVPKYAGNPDSNFVDAIQGKAQPETPAVCGLRVIEVTEAAWKSAANGGRPVIVK